LIVGGGITGLTAAYTLERETDFDVTLIEKKSRLGGKVQTIQKNGYTLEVGPDSIFAAKPAALELIMEIGLEAEIIEPAASGFHLLVDSKLHSVPPGLASLAGVSPQIIDQAGFLSHEGKQRALAEVDVPRGDGSDESITDFFTRRFGEEFCRLVAEPILAGTHAGDPEKLSMRALYPVYLDREQRDGNLSTVSETEPARRGPVFLSLKQGMETLTSRLMDSLTRTQFGIAEYIQRFVSTDSETTVHTDEYPYKHEVDHVLLAVPADEAAVLLKDKQETAKLLSSIRFASSEIITAAYPQIAVGRDLIGTGFLTPFDRDHVLTGCTWSSLKWPGRAPDDMLLVRYFFGGDGRPDGITGNQLLERVRWVANDILKIPVEPTFLETFHWTKALPQYDLGHTDLVDKVEQSLDGSPFSVTGSSYRGVGIPDCIRQGREAARKIAGALS
jgi:oxygen-dependent protoporphyrinogen oxidase